MSTLNYNIYSSELSDYYDQISKRRLVINNETIKTDQSHLTYNIYVKKKCKIEKQGCGTVVTKIYIDGPINNCTIMIKRHKTLPILASLKTSGFIAPTERGELKVIVQNYRNYEIR